MYELLGFALIRLAGWGWLWGKEDYAQFKKSGQEVYANGGVFLFVGIAPLLLGLLAVAVWKAVMK